MNYCSRGLGSGGGQRCSAAAAAAAAAAAVDTARPGAPFPPCKMHGQGPSHSESVRVSPSQSESVRVSPSQSESVRVMRSSLDLLDLSLSPPLGISPAASRPRFRPPLRQTDRPDLYNICLYNVYIYIYIYISLGPSYVRPMSVLCPSCLSASIRALSASIRVYPRLSASNDSSYV